MRRRLEALGLGIRRSALGPIFALSGLTVRESVRQKVFIVLAVFTLVMLGATAMLPAIRPEDRVPLVETWAQRGITFFGVLLVVFLAGVSIPEDIGERKIFTSLSKPLARWQLLAGRFAGFACLLAAPALATGLISAVFLRVVSRFKSPGQHHRLPGVEVRIRKKTPGQHPRAHHAGQTVRGQHHRRPRSRRRVPLQGTPVHDLPGSPLALDVAAEALPASAKSKFIRPRPATSPSPPASSAGGRLAKPRGPAAAAAHGHLKYVAKVASPKFSSPLVGRQVGGDRFRGEALGTRPGTHRESRVVPGRPEAAQLEWNFAKGWRRRSCSDGGAGAHVAGSTVLSVCELLFGIAVFVTGSMIGFRWNRCRPSSTSWCRRRRKRRGEGAPARRTRFRRRCVSQAISKAVIDVVPTGGIHVWCRSAGRDVSRDGGRGLGRRCSTRRARSWSGWRSSDEEFR